MSCQLGYLLVAFVREFFAIGYSLFAKLQLLGSDFSCGFFGHGKASFNAPSGFSARLVWAPRVVAYASPRTQAGG